MQTVVERNKTAKTSAKGHPGTTNGAPNGIRSSVDDYFKMYDAGLSQGRRVQLIRGEIIETAPMGTPRSTAIRLVAKFLRKAFGDGFVVDSQLPLRFGKIDEPEPDVAVIEDDIRDFAETHPSTARLIVEIADSSLKLDRGRKVGLYAENNIAECWIVNLKKRQLEVCRKPITEGETSHSAETFILTEGELVSPLERPDTSIKVREMLP